VKSETFLFEELSFDKIFFDALFDESKLFVILN
jgi:hypothetical protein